MENTFGVMEDTIKAIGNKIKWMASVNLCGLMVEDSKDNILTIKNMAKEFLFGMMEESL